MSMHTCKSLYNLVLGPTCTRCARIHSTSLPYEVHQPTSYPAKQDSPGLVFDRLEIFSIEL